MHRQGLPIDTVYGHEVRDRLCSETGCVVAPYCLRWPKRVDHCFIDEADSRGSRGNIPSPHIWPAGQAFTYTNIYLKTPSVIENAPAKSIEKTSRRAVMGRWNLL